MEADKEKVNGQFDAVISHLTANHHQYGGVVAAGGPSMYGASPRSGSITPKLGRVTPLISQKEAKAILNVVATLRFIVKI